MPSLKQQVVATTTHEVRLSPRLKTKLMTKLRSYAEKKIVRDKLNLEMNGKRNKKTKAIEVVGIQQQVEEIMEEVGELKLTIDGFNTTVVAPVTKGKFNTKKALLQGWTLEQIEACFDEDTPGTSYVKITVPGSKDEDE
jgi:hypothetical protein